MIVRTQRIGFTPDRKPAPSKVKIGFEGDHLVERLEFDLPIISEHQTAMLMLDGKYANAIILQAMERGGRYYVDLTAEMIGEEGIVEAYVVMDGEEGTAWHSDTLRLQVGGVPDVNDELIERFPDAFEQLRGEIAGHRAEMQEASEEIKAEADAARAAVLAAENQAKQAGTHSVTAEAAASDAQEAKSAAQKSAEYAETLHGAVENGVQNALAASDYANFAANNAAQMSASAEVAAMRAEKAAQKTEDALSGGDDGQVLGNVNGEPTWIDPPEVGNGDVTTDALDAAIARHNASSGAHPDIRAMIGAPGGGTGGAVASVNGKTGAVVLTAADVGALAEDELQGAVNDALAQAKESGEFDGAPGADGSSGVHVGSDEPQGDQNVWIDPEGEAWQMPTASATVKGGVKIGEGLQMDGDVLRIKQEDAWRLIETITIEEAVSNVERSVEPDGTEYNLSSLIVVIKCAPGQTPGTTYLWCYNDPAAQSAFLRLATTCHEAPSGWPTIFYNPIVFTCYPTSGLFESWAASASYGSPMIMSKPANAEGVTPMKEKIKRIKILFEKTQIHVGSTIEIWGVRANA